MVSSFPDFHVLYQDRMACKNISYFTTQIKNDFHGAPTNPQQQQTSNTEAKWFRICLHFTWHLCIKIDKKDSSTLLQNLSCSRVCTSMSSSGERKNAENFIEKEYLDGFGLREIGKLWIQWKWRWADVKGSVCASKNVAISKKIFEGLQSFI